MLIAHYTGPAKPGIAAHIGWHLTVLAQKGPYDLCTHTEAIHQLHSPGVVSMASSSLMDKGVRIKERVRLNPLHWIITDVPAWDVQQSIRYFAAAIQAGVRYDKRGALATMLPGKEDAHKVFCTEAVLAPYVRAPHYYSPALGLSLCLSVGRDVTADFFS
jgi:hypothetical protein